MDIVGFIVIVVAVITGVAGLGVAALEVMRHKGTKAANERTAQP